MTENNPFAELITTSTSQSSEESEKLKQQKKENALINNVSATSSAGSSSVSGHVKLSTNEQPQTKQQTPPTQINAYNEKINALAENLFMITVDKKPKKNKQLIFMEDFVVLCPSGLITMEILENIVFERLTMKSPMDYLIPNNVVTSNTNAVTENQVFIYLYGVYARIEKYEVPKQDVIASNACDKIKSMIFNNLITAVRQPELYEQRFGSQLLAICSEHDLDNEIKGKFILDFVRAVAKLDEEVSEVQKADDNENDMSLPVLRGIFFQFFDQLINVINAGTLITLENWIMPTLIGMVSDKSLPHIAKLLIDYNQPSPKENGNAFSSTILGQLLSISILPKRANDPFEYFANPTSDATPSAYQSLCTALTNHLDDLNILFKNILLMGGAVRAKLLQWIGNCLHTNKTRGQIGSSANLLNFGQIRSCSDSLMMGLCGVLLRLCKPLLRPDYKVLLVDPSYCAVGSDIPIKDRLAKNVHSSEMDKETCLIPLDEDEPRKILPNGAYNFITEIFYMTHKAYDLGYRVCIERSTKLNREVFRLQQAYDEALTRPDRQAMVDSSIQMLQKLTQQLYCLQITITEPKNDEYIIKLFEATAMWLTQIAGQNAISMKVDRGYAPETQIPIELPFKFDRAPKVLQCVPEFIIENIVCYLIFCNHYDVQQSIDSDTDAQNAICTMILIFMGNSTFCKNPHLRARLAEGFETLLPRTKGNARFNSSIKRYLFESHPFRLQMATNVLHVFVGIEMTGQSVQFEQKFNYRRPMYIIMKYLWNLNEQRECFKKLADDGEKNIDAVDPPIFLRFINLLINDAIFLLDESLSNLQKIRQIQYAMDQPEWHDTSATEQQQQTSNLQHIGMMAKFDNLLGRDTISMLEILTSEIKGIFCHASMKDRVVSMLNYFLLNLVGPNKKNFKVKNPKEYEFEPALTVLEICKIYINLSSSDSFCLAVSQDGRSYSPQLFEYAEEVLVRIGGVGLISELGDFAKKVKRLEDEEKINQEALIDPPDEFLDPIMSTLMMDPVILPSSKVTIDRPTISRHLLSDQSDPFNRSPLTMDQVKSNVELKASIEQWIQEKRAAYKSIAK